MHDVSEIVEIKELVDETPTIITSDKPKILQRPHVVNARVYKLKSPFTKHSVFITLGYVTENGKNRPIEIFINSKDLSKMSEYTALTRLISMIFRSRNDPEIVIDELKDIYDPNGGYFKNGKYMHSFYSEIADVIQTFLQDIGYSATPQQETVSYTLDDSSKLQVCPHCGQKTLKVENGCVTCINKECGYSKCD